MSRTSTQTQRIASPVKYYIRFSGETGTFSYYDKNTDQEVTLDELEFVVIDTRSSIIGWNDERSGRIFSNYIRTMKEKLIVRCNNDELLNGLYSEIKEKVATVGGKFCSNVFALAQINGDWALVNIQFTASSLKEWSEFTTAQTMRKIYGYIVTAKRGDQLVKGRVKYYTPTFSFAPISQTLAEKADEYDSEKLQPYLNQDNPSENIPVA